MDHRPSEEAPSGSRRLPRGDPGGAPVPEKGRPYLLPPDLEAVLGRLDRGLGDLYGEDRYGGLVLYGSYARGEAHEGSDVDLLLLLHGEVDTTREIVRSEDVTWPLELEVGFEAGYLLSLLPVSVERYETSEAPFLRNARREGFRVGR